GRRERALALRPVQRCRLRDLHEHRPAACPDTGRLGAARPLRVAAAGAVLARPHRHSPLAMRAGAAALLVVVALALSSRARAAGPSRRTFVLGRSVDGRPIRAFELGDPAADRSALVVGCIHGNECAGFAIARELAHLQPPPNTDLWIIPDLNPDGAAAGTR